MNLIASLRINFGVFLRGTKRLQLLNGTKFPQSYQITVLRRSYSNEIENALEKPISKKIVTQLRQFDKVGQDYDLIYRAPRTFGFSSMHICLLLSGLTIPAFFYIIAYKNEFKFPIRINDNVAVTNIEQCYLVLGLTSFILFSMFALVRRFPFRVYRRKETNDYIAVYANILIPWKMEQVKFKKGDVRRLKDSEILVFQIANYKINGQKNILIEEHFSRPADLEFMLDPRDK